MLVELLRGKKNFGCRWVFSVKYKLDGLAERYKARLIAKVYTQTYGIDYLDIFAQITIMNTVRVLLSLVRNLDWNLQYFDTKKCFFIVI